MRSVLTVVLLFGWAAFVLADDTPKLATDLHPPVRLEADGKPIDHGEANGHAGPCVFDVDGDGKRDLVVGDFGGTFSLYKNVGTNDQPRYESGGKLMAGDEPAKVWIYCCIGSSPQFADLDGDGNADLISGSYHPGLCYWFPGNGDGTFRGRGGAKLEELVEDPTGLKEDDGSLQSEGGAANGLPLVDRAGRAILRVPDQQQIWESFGSWPFPIDWDSDGDLDLVIGGFSGSIYLRENLGTREEFAFSETAVAIKAGGQPIGAEIRDAKEGDMHAAVVCADWDGDGLFDLISGFDDGSVRWFRNVGQPGDPMFNAAEVLVPPHDGSGYSVFLDPDKAPPPGIRTQVAVADMNGDDKPDLLIGDFSTTCSPRPDLTSEQQTEYESARERYRMDMTAIRESHAAIYKKLDKFREQFPKDEWYSDEVEEQARERMKQLREAPEHVAAKERFEASQKAVEAYLEKPEHATSYDAYAARHGFVWLYLRK